MIKAEYTEHVHDAVGNQRGFTGRITAIIIAAATVTVLAAGCGASHPSTTSPAPSASQAPITNPGLTFTMIPAGYDQATNETAAILTVKNNQSNTIYLTTVQYNEFDQYGNLISSQAFGNDGWPVGNVGPGGNGHWVSKLAVNPGQTWTFHMQVDGDVASFQITGAQQSYSPDS